MENFDFATREKQLQRKQKLAEMLMQRGQQPNKGQMVGRFFVGSSPMEGISNLASSLVGAKMSNDLAEQETDLTSQRRDALTKALTGAMSPRTEKSVLDRDDQADAGSMLPTRTRQPTRQEQIDSLMSNPDTQSLAVDMYKEQRKPMTLDKGDKVFVDGKVVAENPDTTPQPQQIVTTADGVFQVDRNGSMRKLGDKPLPQMSATKQQQLIAKQNSINALKLQLGKVKEAFYGQEDPVTKQRKGGIKGSLSAGMLQGHLPTESGQAFDKAVAMLSPFARQITRTPGEGAMSDYESRLVTMGLPSRTDYESTTEKQIQDWEDLINVLETGYGDIMPKQPNAPGQSPQNGTPSIDDLLTKYGRPLK